LTTECAEALQIIDHRFVKNRQPADGQAICHEQRQRRNADHPPPVEYSARIFHFTHHPCALAPLR